MIIECIGLPGSGKTTLVREIYNQEPLFRVPKEDADTNKFGLLEYGMWFFTLCIESFITHTFSLFRYKLAVYRNTCKRVNIAYNQDGVVVIDEGMLQRILTLYEQKKTKHTIGAMIGHTKIPDAVLVVDGDKKYMFSRYKNSHPRNMLGEKYREQWKFAIQKNYTVLVEILKDMGIPIYIVHSDIKKPETIRGVIDWIHSLA